MQEFLITSAGLELQKRLIDVRDQEFFIERNDDAAFGDVRVVVGIVAGNVQILVCRILQNSVSGETVGQPHVDVAFFQSGYDVGMIPEGVNGCALACVVSYEPVMLKAVKQDADAKLLRIDFRNGRQFGNVRDEEGERSVVGI